MGTTLSLRCTSRMLVVSILLIVTLFAGLNVQRAAAQPASEAGFLCASMYTGTINYQPSGCPAGYRTLDLTAGAVTVCWNIYTGGLRYAAPMGACGTGYRPLVLGGAIPMTVCTSRYTRAVTFSANRPCPAGTFSVQVAEQGPTVTVQSSYYDAVADIIVMDIIVTGFPPYGFFIGTWSMVSVLPVRTIVGGFDANGTFDFPPFDFVEFGCFESGSMTFIDQEGNTATANLTFDCP